MLGKVLKVALGEAHEGGTLGTLVASGVSGRGDGEGEWLVWAVSLAMSACDDPRVEGGIPFREAGSIFPASKGISSPLAAGAFGAMGVGLLREMPMGSCSGLSGIAIDRSSSISVVMLGWETISLWYSVTECRDEICVEDH